MVDTVVVGHLPSVDNIATVALGTMVFDVLFWCCGFLRMSTTSITSQEPNCNKIYYQSMIIALLLSFALIISSPFFKKGMFLFIDTELNISKLLLNYFDIRIFSAVPTLINYVNYGFLFGKQNTKTPLVILLIVNSSAMLFDYIFVWQFNMGASGIAIANLITQSIGAILGSYFIYTNYLKPSVFIKIPDIIDFVRFKKLLALNRDIFIRTLFLVLTVAFFTRQSAYLGSTVVAANMILMNLQITMSYAMDGFAIAAETLIGRAISRKNRLDFFNQVKACAKWSFAFSVIFSLIYYVFGAYIISLMTSLIAVKKVALEALPWVYFLPILSVAGFLLDGVYIGAAWSKELRNAILFASIFVFLPVWFFSRPLANQGLWLAYTSFMIARGVYLLISLQFKKNKSHQWLFLR